MWTYWSIEHWTTFAAGYGNVPFNESDPYFGSDLGFFVYWLPFEQTLIKVDPNLKYSELIKVIDVFSEVFSAVKKPAKISFSEMTSADSAG